MSRLALVRRSPLCARLPSSLGAFGLLVLALPACASGEGAVRYDMRPDAALMESEGEAYALRSGGGGAPGSAYDDDLDDLAAGDEGFEEDAEPAAERAPPVAAEPEHAIGANAPERRMVIYSATLHVVVSEPDRARRRFLDLVTERGGHLQRSDRDTIVVRVPSATFEEVADAARRLGRVADEQVEARDVTRQVFELSMRIDNAERARVRLLELLERGGELEHVLRLEQELRRVTEEIELLKGKRRQLEGEAAYSTIALRLSSHAPAPTPIAQRKMSPFPWVRELGPEQVLAMPLTHDDLPDLLPASIDVPGRFVSIEEGPFEIRAVSAEGARVWLRTRFVEGADLDFWQTALLDELDAIRGYDVVRTERHTLADGRELLEIVAETTLAAAPYRYQLLVEVGSTPLLGTWVKTLEHVGETKDFDAAALDLRGAAGIGADKASQSALAQEGD